MRGDARIPESGSSGGPPPELGELLRQASHAMRHRFSDVLKPWDLSPHQFRALRVINASEPLRLRDLADQLRITPRSVTEVVDALSDRGLAERAPDPGDRRAMTVSTTSAGRRLMQDVERAGHADSADFFGRLSEPERRQLAKLLGKLTAPEQGRPHHPGPRHASAGDHPQPPSLIGNHRS
ncbi:MAG: winged helix-turn-helix transcriptional regulator [Microlunatus sp.]|nr:winged helix-turn-helix transcriptional regulator [Microlunatus sp.]